MGTNDGQAVHRVRRGSAWRAQGEPGRNSHSGMSGSSNMTQIWRHDVAKRGIILNAERNRKGYEDNMEQGGGGGEQREC